MCKIAPFMIIKLLCILSLLYVTSTAQIFGSRFPYARDNDDLRIISTNQNDEDNETRTQGDLPGSSPRLFKGFGFGKPDQGLDNNVEDHGKENDTSKDDKPKEKGRNLKDIFNKDIKDRTKENLAKEQKGDNNEKNNIHPKMRLGIPNFPMPNFPMPHLPIPNFPMPNFHAPDFFDIGVEIALTDYEGKWEIVSLNSGVSAMHLQLLPTSKFAMFDATSLGKSSIELPSTRCRLVPNTVNVFDCYAHAVEYDPVTNNVRSLKVETNPWCSSGGLAADGTLINTGGWEEGEQIIRHYKSCETCDWKELDTRLADNRWYATQAMLADGRFIVVGGRRAFNYELMTPSGHPIPGRIDLPLLYETTDLHENNLYPFVHIAPDGNVFILANNKAVLLDVRTNKIVRKYPDLPGGARNYPGSGTSAILPINLNRNINNVDMEVLVCGGGQPLAFGKADKEGIYLPALDTCGKIQVLNPRSNWEIETMPSPRVMSDMLNLPNGEILILNGAKKGASGWQFADEPILNPFLYSPNKPNGKRFKVLSASRIPRMYHSSSAVLPDGKILVAGSNTNAGYLFTNVKFPTELRVEKFSPPYLDPKLQKLMPTDVNLQTKDVGYGKIIFLTCKIGQNYQSREPVMQKDVAVTLYKPPFTTHGYSMDQRILILRTTFFAPSGPPYSFNLQVQAPPRAELAPPGYYLLFLNYRGVPSPGSWIQLH